ncbi:TPA: DUF1642 domain-containing protein [Streptococcus suis]|nr:DUF1642 domain-containing protein [Streptococcus suis]
MNKQEAIEKIKNIGTLSIFDKVASQQVEMVIKNEVLDTISQIDEPQKPKVPRVAVEFYEKYKDEILSLDEWFSDFYSKEAIEDFPRMEELTEWLHDNDNETNRRRELALATLVTLGIDAVEIEKEKLYTVEIPNPNNEYSMNALTRLPSSGKITLVALHKPNTSYLKNKEYQLTKSEIKKDFEWAWQFAKEVE